MQHRISSAWAPENTISVVYDSQKKVNKTLETTNKGKKNAAMTPLE